MVAPRLHNQSPMLSPVSVLNTVTVQVVLGVCRFLRHWEAAGLQVLVISPAAYVFHLMHAEILDRLQNLLPVVLFAALL
jgi:uncharacterized membrane protein